MRPPASRAAQSAWGALVRQIKKQLQLQKCAGIYSRDLIRCGAWVVGVIIIVVAFEPGEGG